MASSGEHEQGKFGTYGQTGGSLEMGAAKGSSSSNEISAESELVASGGIQILWGLPRDLAVMRLQQRVNLPLVRGHQNFQGASSNETSAESELVASGGHQNSQGTAKGSSSSNETSAESELVASGGHQNSQGVVERHKQCPGRHL